MGASAGFGRRSLPEPRSFDHDGYDVSPLAPNYQMVPAGGSRVWTVRVSGGRVAIVSLDPLIAGIMPPSLPPGAPVPDYLLFHDRSPNLHDFRVVGRKVGRTYIVAFDEQFNELARLTVSVKEEKPLTYNLLWLIDPGHPPPKDNSANLAVLDRVMKNVEKLFINAANRKLVRMNTRELYVEAKLGDPIKTDPSPEGRKNAPQLIRDRIKELGLDGVDRNLVFTWDIDDAGTAGYTMGMGPMCMVELDSDETMLALHAAHELGHSFKLRHEYHFSFQLLMSWAPSGCRMHGVDIDAINPSGT